MPKLEFLSGLHPRNQFKNGLRIGMKADDVLKFARRKFVRKTRGPEKIGENDFGYIVKWFYPGVILTMQREKKIGPYKVAKINLGKVKETVARNEMS